MAEAQILDVHDRACRYASCGFENDVLLRGSEIAAIARRMRGIGAIAAVMAAEDSGATPGMLLGDFLRGGLIDAVAMLAWDADAALQDFSGGAVEQGACND